MTDKPKRRWLQIHLSTAIVLMIVTGGLLGVNLRPSHHRSYYIDQGWPEVFRTVEDDFSVEWNPNGLLVDASVAILLCIACPICFEILVCGWRTAVPRNRSIRIVAGVGFFFLIVLNVITRISTVTVVTLGAMPWVSTAYTQGWPFTFSTGSAFAHLDLLLLNAMLCFLVLYGACWLAELVTGGKERRT